MKEIIMIFEWQWDNEEIKMLEKLSKIKEEYAKKAIKFVESLPVSQQRLAFHEACDPSYEIFWKGGQMNGKFRTKEKESPQ